MVPPPSTFAAISMLAALMLVPATALLAPRAPTFPRTPQPVTALLAPPASTCLRTSQPVTALLAPPASTCPRTSQPVMLIPAVDDITLASSTLAQFIVSRGPLDVARDFVEPIMFAIDNDPLWKSVKLVGMVGVSVYQIRKINLITERQIGAAPKLDQAALDVEKIKKYPTMLLVPVVLIADTFSSLIDGVRAGLGGPPPESPEEVLQRVRDLIERPTRE